MQIFLGGTYGSTWRDELIPLLKIKYFNPIVDNWTDEHQEEELIQRKNCDFCLYVITPKMVGVYSIAEAVDDSNKRPEKTLFCILKKDNGNTFLKFQMKSLEATANLIEKNGGHIFHTLEDVAFFVNNRKEI